MNGSALTSREKRQFISIENNVSPVKELFRGVPQGSALASFLFLIYIYIYIYINDRHESINLSKTYHSADSTSIVQSILQPIA